MELLIQELKDRDKELNFMVRSHQQQLDIWAQDKSKVPMLEQRCANLGEMLSHKENDIQVLNANLSRSNGQATETAAEIKRLSRECQLEHARLKRSSLLLATADAKVARAGILEKSLQSLLHSKDKELTSMSKKLEEVQNLLDVRVQPKRRNELHNRGLLPIYEDNTTIQHTCIEEIKNDEVKLRQQVALLALEREKEKHSKQCLQGDLLECRHQNEHMSLELSKATEELEAIKRHLQVARDGEQRKEQLLVLQRSKIERYGTELRSLRKVYGQQSEGSHSRSLNISASERPATTPLLPVGLSLSPLTRRTHKARILMEGDSFLHSPNNSKHLPT